MSVLFAASEIFPYAKSGGLADVADALPDALKNHVEVSRVMPLYSFMQTKKLKRFHSFMVKIATIEYEVEVFILKKNGVTNYFIKAPQLSTSDAMYGTKENEYENNDLRFALFCMAIVILGKYLKITVLHLNDWHTAMAALYVKELGLDVKTIFTIHNLAYQGLFNKNTICKIGLDMKYFTSESLEFYDKVNFLKAGIAYSDVITTVSPNYAKEILTREFGCGLDGFLSYHKEKLQGILNGINTRLFHPAKDSALIAPFSVNSIEKKHLNKINFIKNSSLKDPRVPLFIMVTRLVEQKGLGLVLDILEDLLAQKINFFIIGEGDKKISQDLRRYSKTVQNFEYFQGYDEVLAHKAYAAADFLLMPSSFEPCGLTQFISMNYATIPIVHAVGGLKDSVHEKTALCGQGIVYEQQNKKELLFAIQRALELKKNIKKFTTVRKSNMECDFSFRASALKYIKLYKSES